MSNTNDNAGAAMAPFSESPCSGFWYVDVRSPGAEGTINLFWKEHAIQWIRDPEIAAEIREYIDAANADLQQAISTIESVAGFDDETTSVGEAWKTILCRILPPKDTRPTGTPPPKRLDLDDHPKRRRFS